MIVHIMDPGLRELAGHHYDFVVKLNTHLTELGHSVYVYSNINTTSDVLSKFNNITPHFRSFPYPQHHGEILDYHNHSKMMCEDLLHTPDADLWVWPSTFSFQVNGARLLNRNIKSVGCVHVEHNYHHDVYGIAQWLDAQNNMFKLFAMEPKLVQNYIDIGVACAYAPNPANNITEPLRTKLNTIGFFGHQRADKGSNNIKSIIDHLVDEYTVILHDSSGSVRYDHPKVICYNAVPVLADIIRQCDLVILPYDRNKYKKMSSGILCEALSLGIPCIVPTNTTQEDWINRTGSGIAFSEYNVLAAIKQARTDYERISTNAHNTSLQWPLHYGIDKFTSTLIGI